MKKQKKFISDDIGLASAISILLEVYSEFKVENSKNLLVLPAIGGANNKKADSK